MVFAVYALENLLTKVKSLVARKQAGKNLNDWKEAKLMVMTDPIADLLTRIRNANSVRHEVVEVPSSNVKKAIVNILLQ